MAKPNGPVHAERTGQAVAGRGTDDRLISVRSDYADGLVHDHLVMYGEFGRRQAHRYGDALLCGRAARAVNGSKKIIAG